MTQKHDFEAALREFERWHERIYGAYNEHLNDDNYLSIIFALKLAQKVTGEPSEGMLLYAYKETQRNLRSSALDKIRASHKAMVNQAIKEIESEGH